MLGIFTLLMLMTLYVPLIGLITFLAMAAPIVIFTVRNGWKVGIWLLIPAAILSVLLGSPLALVLSIPASTVGLIMGHLISQKANRYAILGAATGVYLINYIIAYVVAIVLFNIDIMDMVNASVNESIEASVAIATALGQENAEKTMEAMKNMVKYTNYLLPALFVLTSITHAYFTQLITVFIVKRLKIEVSSFPPFRELQLPKSLLWYYLLVLLISFTQPEEGSTMFMAILNLTFILTLLLTVQGYSFVFFYCHKKGIHKALPITVLILSFLITPLVYIIRMIGIIDMGFPLRDKIQPKK